MIQEEILGSTQKKEKKETLPEPNLFEEPAKKKGKLGLFLLPFFLAAIFFVFWGPKGAIEGEALLKSDQMVQVGVVTPGVLRELLHKKGDEVKQGEILARFENKDISEALSEKELQLEVLNHKKTQLLKKQEFSKKDKDRKTLLFENGVIGYVKVDEAELDLNHASEDAAALDKEIESFQKEILFLKDKLKTLEITAPFSGVILNDSSEKTGNYFKEGEKVFDFVDPSTFYLEVNVLEKEIEKIKIGDSAKVVFRATPDRNYTGQVVKIGPETEKEIEKVFKVKHVVPVAIKLSEVLSHARYGMHAWVQIKPNGTDGAAFKNLTLFRKKEIQK